MLAQSFLSAADLGITEPQRDALQKVLVLLETGKLAHEDPDDCVADQSANFTGHFNMSWWRNKHSCGTVACIGGTAEMIGDVTFDRFISPALEDLFHARSIPMFPLSSVTTAQAARALRSYLTCGDARWAEAVAT